MNGKGTILALLLAVLCFTPAFVSAGDNPQTFQFGPGTLTTPPGAFGQAAMTLPIVLDVDASAGGPPFEVIFSGVDFSGVNYTDGNLFGGCSPATWGAFAIFNVENNVSFSPCCEVTRAKAVLQSAMPCGGDTSWDGKSVNHTPENDSYSKYLLQAGWITPSSAGGFSDECCIGNFQYNPEARQRNTTVTRTPDHTPTPQLSEFETFDIRILLVPDGAGQYTQTTRVRLHSGSSWEEGIDSGAGFALASWTQSIDSSAVDTADLDFQNQYAPTAQDGSGARENIGAWQIVGVPQSPFSGPGNGPSFTRAGDLSEAQITIELLNGPASDDPGGHTITWNHVTVRGVPHPRSKKLCKHGGWTLFTIPSFKNQGECEKFFAKKEKHEHEHDDE